LPKIEFRPKSRVKPASVWLNQKIKNVTSQCGQDGIFQAMLEVIRASNKWCCEFGAWDGKYLSNTWNLIANHGWTGVLIEGDPAKFAELQNTHANNKVMAYSEFVSFEGPNRLDEILRRAGAPRDLDMLSIDIDGNDWHVWESLRDFRPRIVCIEFNPTISNDVYFVQDRDPNIRQGCSLLALIDLAKEKGYELVATPSWDGIFVPQELFPQFNIADNSIDAMYSPALRETRIFQGYDGKFWCAGNLTVQWKNVAFAADRLQVLPPEQWD
jgi:hypothetical protein